MNKIISFLLLSIFLCTMCKEKKKEEPTPVVVIPTNPGFPNENIHHTINGDVKWNGGLHLKQVGQCSMTQEDTLFKLAMTRYATDSVRLEQSMYIKSYSVWSGGEPLVGTIKGNNLSLIQKNKVFCFGSNVVNTYHYTGIIETIDKKTRLTITGTETWCQAEDCIFDVKYVVYQE